MRFHKFISTILHPIVVPTIGVILYFILIPHSLVRKQQLIMLGLVFGFTYILPVVILLILKGLNLIENFQLHSIKERKIPLFLMIVVFYFLGKSLYDISLIRDLAMLFYGTSLSLFILYFLFMAKFKTSIHLLSMGNALGFFLILTHTYSIGLTPIIMIIILLSGLLGSSRLHLNAHTPKEVYAGFFLGMISQFLVFAFL
ncbi:hypothetical protein RQM59_09420 [Flavobacteriaceae bacterium S356]|uniref:PAP2 superfamily protein n=1 Tax=Asprobacillus argus TaxID=3076534 RepID=A0ABU3LHC1_9FLAO|nr:hypothetical protein [Flavobacteriaceae bacterium S356]